MMKWQNDDELNLTIHAQFGGRNNNVVTKEVQIVYTAHIVESVHFFLVILLPAEPLRIVPQVSNAAEPLDFVSC